MATKRKDEEAEGASRAGESSEGGGLISFGPRFRATVNERGQEGRLGDDKEKSYFLSRYVTANRQLEQGATYELLARKVADAPGPETVLAEIPAGEVGSLPAGSKVVD